MANITNYDEEDFSLSSDTLAALNEFLKTKVVGADEDQNFPSEDWQVSKNVTLFILNSFSLVESILVCRRN